MLKEGERAPKDVISQPRNSSSREEISYFSKTYAEKIKTKQKIKTAYYLSSYVDN